MNIQQDAQEQVQDEVNTVPKFTKLYSKAVEQFKIRVFFLFLERVYLIISMTIILVIIGQQSCNWNDLHYWVLFSDIQAVFSLILYAQLFQFSNIPSIISNLAFHYGQIVFVPQNEATDHPVAPEILDPTAALSDLDINKKADVMAMQIRQEIVNENKFCKINNIFSNVTNQGIFIWTMYYFISGTQYTGSPQDECLKWPDIQVYIYGILLFIQYSQYYLLAALAIVVLPFVLCYLIVRCFTNRRKKQEAMQALRDLQKNKIIYKPNILAGEQECSICMQPYVSGDEVLQLPCSQYHHFHNNCISAWLQVQSTCPNCRQQLIPQNIQEPLLEQQDL